MVFVCLSKQKNMAAAKKVWLRIMKVRTEYNSDFIPNRVFFSLKFHCKLLVLVIVSVLRI